MTQEELKAAVDGGKATVEEPQSSGPDNAASAPASAPAVQAPQELSLQQFIPILVGLQSTQKYLSAAPTFIPQTFQDQIQFVFDGTNYFAYFYANNQWNFAQLNSGSTGFTKRQTTTLANVQSSITVSGIPARKSLMIFAHLILAGASDAEMIFNGDTAAHYSLSRYKNFAIDSAGGPNSNVALTDTVPTTRITIVGRIANIASDVKQGEFLAMVNGNKTTTPIRYDTIAVWDNNTNQITSIKMTSGTANAYQAGSYIAVFMSDD
jgi:hypothetical protein